MIRSMTGYSRVETEEAGLSLTVSIRGTNHRFLDPQLRLPSSLESLEPTVRRLLKEHVTRGHVEISVGLTGAGATELKIDRKLLTAYLQGYQTLKKEFGAAAEPDLMALLRVPGLVVSGNGDMTPEDLDRLRQLLEPAMAKALTQLNEMRAREGESLEKDLLSRLSRLEALRRTISHLAERAPQFYKQRLEGRIRDLAGSGEMDSGRLAQEVAYLASRSDIAEELTRFQSHLDQIRHLLAETSEIGKKLDFLLQEMNREANTLLSKTTDVPEVGLEITRQAIEMKTEIEKLREQAQNIE
ncbi:MAG: YicC/YloC family endoribonuclease [Terriglobia bacterium]